MRWPAMQAGGPGAVGEPAACGQVVKRASGECGQGRFTNGRQKASTIRPHPRQGSIPHLSLPRNPGLERLSSTYPQKAPDYYYLLLFLYEKQQTKPLNKRLQDCRGGRHCLSVLAALMALHLLDPLHLLLGLLAALAIVPPPLIAGRLLRLGLRRCPHFPLRRLRPRLGLLLAQGAEAVPVRSDLWPLGTFHGAGFRLGRPLPVGEILLAIRALRRERRGTGRFRGTVELPPFELRAGGLAPPLFDRRFGDRKSTRLNSSHHSISY